LTNAFGDVDEFRKPANLALRVTFNVIYPPAPAQSRVHRHATFAKASIFAEKLRRDETAGQAIARRKVMRSAVRVTTLTDSLHSHNSNHRVKGFASRGIPLPSL